MKNWNNNARRYWPYLLIWLRQIHSGSVKNVAVDLDARGLATSACKSSVAKVAEVGKDIGNLLK
jgi:hypothetical protein